MNLLEILDRKQPLTHETPATSATSATYLSLPVSEETENIRLGGRPVEVADVADVALSQDAAEWQFSDGTDDSATAGTRAVRCLDCQRCEPNEHTPALGWCGCRAGHHREHGWPAAPRICSAFEEGPPGLN